MCPRTSVVAIGEEGAITVHGAQWRDSMGSRNSRAWTIPPSYSAEMIVCRLELILIRRTIYIRFLCRSVDYLLACFYTR